MLHLRSDAQEGNQHYSDIPKNPILLSTKAIQYSCMYNKRNTPNLPGELYVTTWHSQTQ